ncbi:hypothetical protein NON00_18675 [Roseomonas sp. GC11]|uniref:hypothetical protein n=1 Tax=Roseomonas sp. GC11 TaxID=2950546 RepID=UPI00210E71B0|nr:hypothetical protein [Roseomonas sp. GC11]MCQ4161944.1 hypothetical protein [Roseomonas sp. GC11]
MDRIFPPSASPGGPAEPRRLEPSPAPNQAGPAETARLARLMQMSRPAGATPRSEDKA